MGSIPEVQNFSLKVRKVLESDLQMLDADWQSSTQCDIPRNPVDFRVVLKAVVTQTYFDW